MFAATLWPRALRSHPHTLPIKRENSPGAEMLKYSGHFVYFLGPECDPINQAYSGLFLASKMGRAMREQVIQVCNGAFCNGAFL